MNNTPRNPANIANYATRYEIVLRANGHTQVLAYTERHTRRGIIDVMQTNADLILAALPEEEDILWDAKRRAYVGPSVTVGFSGRTEREAFFH
jgi:hypothetical protein